MKTFNVYVVFLLILMVFFAGCGKRRCYNCYSFLGYFMVSKNGDTLRSGGYSTGQYNDSLNYYRGLGYIIDTQVTLTGGVRVCDTNQAYNGQPARDSCVIII